MLCVSSLFHFIIRPRLRNRQEQLLGGLGYLLGERELAELFKSLEVTGGTGKVGVELGGLIGTQHGGEDVQ